ncbi:MAG: styrene monooxygenase/indole monooxygenase family protein [Acidimicrobiia bacterium]
MADMAIIGAGQAGTLAAVGLMRAGHQVTLYSDQTAESILNETHPTGTAFIFGDGVAYERKHGVDTFEDRALPADGIHLYFSPKVGQELVQVSGLLDEGKGYAVDVRLKSKLRMDQLEAGGASVVIEDVSPSRLDQIARENDLTIVATGKGSLAAMFERDPVRSVYDQPQRYLAMVIVKNIPTDGTGFPNRLPGNTPVCFNFYGDIGEFFWVPYYHKTEGRCWNLVIEAKTGGPLDTYRAVTSAEQMLEAVREIVKSYARWDWETMKDMELVDNDPLCWLRGAVPPTVRKPVAHTETGRAVWSLGDTSIAFDPIGGQGAGSGARQAGYYVDAIIERGGGPFDEVFMEATFEGFHGWHGGPAYNFNNVLLEPLDAIGKLVLISAFGDQRAATRFFEGFNRPWDLYPMLTDKAAARRWVSEATGGSWRKANIRGMGKIIKGQLQQKTRGRHFVYDDSV